MTKAELHCSRSLMAETNSILAGLDSTRIHDAIKWGHLGCTAVEKVKTFSGNATCIEWRVLIEEAAPDACEFRTLVAAWSPRNLRNVAHALVRFVGASECGRALPIKSTPGLRRRGALGGIGFAPPLVPGLHSLAGSPAAQVS
jgi:hypothetical protein